MREKLWSEQATQPESVTVMIKRQKGFQVSSNDWEFMVFEGLGAIQKTEVQTGSCLDCHKQKEKDDYVFRTYLPTSNRMK